MNTLIQELKKKQLVWQGAKQHRKIHQSPSGYPEIDSKLEGGFPKVGVIDIESAIGIGELRLIMPHIVQLAEERVIVFVNPPAHINADYLYQESVNFSQVLIIQVPSEKDGLWAAEQCLKSGACSAVIHWYQNLEIHQVKRFQHAADIGESLHVLFKKQQQYALSLPVSLSMKLTAHSHGINISIPKRKGGWPLPTFSVDMSQHWPDLTIAPSAANVVKFPQVSVL